MITQYVGVPFQDQGESWDGADCYGILRLIYSQDLGIEIPSFKASCYNTKAIFMDYLRQVSQFWERVETPQPYDVVAMAHDPAHPKVVQHFGIYVGCGKILHTLEHIGAHLTTVEELNYFIKGYYRWQPKSSNSTTRSTLTTRP